VRPSFNTKQILCLVIVGGLLLMENIDAWVLNVAIPYMATDLNTKILNLKIAITFYLVGLSVFIPICGWISDKYGLKNTLIASIILFVVTSALCAQTDSMLLLVVYRFLQGASGAFMIPVGRLLLLKMFDKSLITRAYIIITYPALLGPMLAPVLGGYLVTEFSWRYIFLINIPVGIIALIATFFVVDNYKDEVKAFNFTNFTLLALALVCLSLFLDLALLEEISVMIKLLLLLGGMVILFAYYLVERGSDNPVIRYKLFNYPVFKSCFYSSMLVRFGINGRMFVIAIMLERLYMMSAYQTGIIFLYFAFGLMGARFVMTRIVHQIGYKKLLTYANLFSVVSVLLLISVTSVGPWLYFVLFLNGMSTSSQFISLNILAYADVEKEDFSAAVSLISIDQQLSNSIGIVIVATTLYLSNYAIGINFTREAFTVTFIVIALIAFSAQLFFRKLDDTSGSNLLEGNK